MKVNILWYKIMIFISICIGISAQSDAQLIFKEVVIQSDTNFYYYTKNSVQYLNEKFLFFKVKNSNEVCEFTIYPTDNHLNKEIELLPSSDFSLLDSLQFINGQYYRGKIQFHDLRNIRFPRFVIRAKDQNGKYLSEEIKLYPYFETSIQPTLEVTELYEGEEKIIDLPSTNTTNIRIDDHWHSLKILDYKISLGEEVIHLHIHPKAAGTESFSLSLKTIKPYLDDFNHLTYEIPSVQINFSVLPSRINYLNFDKNEFFFDPQFNTQSEVQIDNNRNISLKRTYRIENQQEPGGRLIAELFTKSVVGSDKILCMLRAYSLHKVSEGYLYVKENDVTKFVANFNIIQRPSADKFSILREGENWTENLTVYPGEKIEVKIEGSSLGKADFFFDIGQENFKADSTRHADNIAYYYLKIPSTFSKKKISVLMNKEITRYELLLREYQVPRDLDFVSISYDAEQTPVTNAKFNKPILKREPIKDINILFDQRKIDTKHKIFGKQFLSIEIKIFNAAKDLIEIQRIDNIVICPGDNSPRYSFYDTKDCKNNSINLNDYLLHKTYDLDGWSQVELTIKHMESKYALPGFSKKIILIKERLVLLDMQVSFPAGLLVKNFGESGIGRFTGISTAFLAQLSFYDRQRIGRVKPYKVGAGLIALDVFNTNSTQRDLGIVVLGSLFPVKNSRFSFPLYGGFGYLIQTNKWFLVFGPGIQFNF